METQYWQKDIETADRDTIRQLQQQKLVSMLEYVNNLSGFYQRKFDSSGVDITKVKKLEDLKELPFTERSEIVADQAEHGRLGSLMCTKFTDTGQTIGRTGDRFSYTGEPIKVLISYRDTASGGMLAARGLVSVGMDAKQYFYIADYPQFNLIYMNMGLGCINVHCTSLLIGMERAERNIKIYMPLYPPNAFFISPSYAREMTRLLTESQSKFPIRVVVGWNEPGYSLPTVRQQMQQMWGQVSSLGEVKACDAYGMGEMGLLGFECLAQEGIHGFEDHYIYEIIDPDTGRNLDWGQEGELVVTHLQRQGMPLIRYRTGDITTLNEQPCVCGRTHLRLGGIKGRAMDRLEVDGKPIYASQVDEAVAQAGPGPGSYNIFINGTRKLQALELGVNQDQLPGGDGKALQEAVQKSLGIPVNVQPKSAEELFIYPHRSRRIIQTSNLDFFRRELEVQTKVEN